ncbi:MAG: hypothetical protein JNG88_05655 [Phycisphaerales bacterium]|nr:hypothetical protein [Phycisphaerales bacterium]
MRPGFSSGLAWFDQSSWSDWPAGVAARLRQQPRCAVARYVAGCRCFDANRPAIAVRHLMIANHADAQLESAALLVFAGLAWISDPTRTLLETLAATWIEYRRMPFDRTPRERELLDHIAARVPLEAYAANANAAVFRRIPILRLRETVRIA